MSRSVIAIACAAATSCVATPIFAHTPGISQSVLEQRDAATFRLVLMFQRFDGMRLIELRYAAPAGAGDDPVAHARLGARRFLDEGVRLAIDGVPCTATLEDVGPAQADAYGVSASMHCASSTGALRLDMPFIERLGASHQHLSSVIRRGVRSDHVMEAGATSIALGPVSEDGAAAGPATGWFGAVRGMLAAGVWHILRGWDHLLFVLALILATPRVGRLLGVLTAFTLAHSFTLALTALGILALPSRIVEPAIAASIAVVALQSAFGRPVRHGWAVAFAFGLIHGAGFGAALGDLDVARQRIVPALLGFNAGVELGQIAAVLVLWPLLGLFRSNERAVRGVALSVGAVGAALVFVRILR